jgi:hypothetical protein
MKSTLQNVKPNADGEPMGYEIRFASKHPGVIAEALQVLQRGNQIAAE